MVGDTATIKVFASDLEFHQEMGAKGLPPMTLEAVVVVGMGAPVSPIIGLILDDGKGNKFEAVISKRLLNLASEIVDDVSRSGR